MEYNVHINVFCIFGLKSTFTCGIRAVKLQMSSWILQSVSHHSCEKKETVGKILEGGLQARSLKLTKRSMSATTFNSYITPLLQSLPSHIECRLVCTGWAAMRHVRWQPSLYSSHEMQAHEHGGQHNVTFVTSARQPLNVTQFKILAGIYFNYQTPFSETNLFYVIHWDSTHGLTFHLRSFVQLRSCKYVGQNNFIWKMTRGWQRNLGKRPLVLI